MMSITITKKDLQKHNACPTGMQLFDRIATTNKNGGPTELVIEWTPLHDVWLAVAYPGFASWLRDKKLIPIPDLGGADLRSANLSDADLGGAYGVAAPPEGWKIVNGYLRHA